MNGSVTLDEEIERGKLILSGSSEALESFRNKWLRICDLPNTVNAEVPIARSVRMPSTDANTFNNNVVKEKLQPLKAGWLLKKRDIFTGWRCRFFVAYSDRLEYFIDQYDSTPKATMSLLDVEIQSVKRVTVQSGVEHWGFV